MGPTAALVPRREGLRRPVQLDALLNDFRASRELGEGIHRATFPLPFAIDYVHCYLLRTRSGGWILVDTGLGLPDAAARWSDVLAELDGAVERIVVTHFHPDHLGAAADVAALTGARVAQGRLDHEQAVAAWGERRAPDALAAHMRLHGLPDEDAELLHEQSMQLAQLVHLVDDPEPLDPGDEVDGWEVLHLPGHADGHICLIRDGILIAGDALLGDISPNVGLYPNCRPDPLGDFLDSLERIAKLAPRIAYAGHGAPIEGPAARARELVAHHRDRLDQVAGALGSEPRNAYAVSLDVFPEPLPAVQRRFALVETLAHLERLARAGRAVRVDGPAYVSA